MDPEKVSQILEQSEKGLIKRPEETLGIIKLYVCRKCEQVIIGRPVMDSAGNIVALFQCDEKCGYAWAKRTES